MTESENLKKYRELEAERKRLELKYGHQDAPEYDAHLDKMDDAWYKLTEEEVKLINKQISEQ